MNRRAWKYMVAAIIVVAVAAGGGADARRRVPFNDKLRAALTTDGVSCAEIDASVFPGGCPDNDDLGGAAPGPAPGAGGVSATNAFVDGFTTGDQILPSVVSANSPAASVGRIRVGDGPHVLFVPPYPSPAWELRDLCNLTNAVSSRCPV